MTDVLATATAEEYQLLQTVWFPAPIASVTPSSTRNPSFFDVSHVTDGKLTSAWAPAADDDAPHLIFNLENTYAVDSLNIKLSLGQVSSTANQRVLVDVYVSNDGGATWTQVVNDFRPRETTLASVSYPATQANAVRLQFRAEGDDDISNLHVCEAVIIDPVSSTPTPGPTGSPGTTPSSSPSASSSPSSSPDPSPSPVNSPSPSTSPSTDVGGGGSSPSPTPTPTPTPSASSSPPSSPSTPPSSNPSPSPSASPSTPTSSSCGVFNTFSRGGWGQSVGSSSVPATYRDDNWVAIENAFGGSPGAVNIGILSFDEPVNLVAWFDSKPSSMAAQIVAFDLNMRRSILLSSGATQLEDVVIGDGPFAGDTIAEFYDKAMAALAGDLGGYSSGDFTTQAADINLFFHFPGNSPDGKNYLCP